ncbi:GntR family transcriptional regulator [Occultella kanbiaonis]|uniref:GntR family transcriptional regulator n=1 Tax=Occultella kanbiaonis TaxID=2675754 RepID=UPI0013D38AF7|nr:GntR family transcriptional regulator [Occultella kanbiaonis]
MTTGHDATQLPIVVDRDSTTPLYLQVAQAVEAAIVSGSLAPGSRLEGEVSMATRLGLSRPTVRQGLQELTERGLVQRERGVGTQVLDRRTPSDDGSRNGLHHTPAGRHMPGTLTGNIGLAVPDFANPFFAETAQFIERRARELGYFLLTADTDEDPATELATIARMRDQADGLIIAAPRAADDQIRELLADAQNAVLINRRVPGLAGVNVDISIGMNQAVAHLAALGHSHVGYVAGPATSRAGHRIEASLREAAQVHGCEIHTLGHVEPNHAGGFAAADVVIAAKVTAVVAHNDLVAFGLISRLIKRGLQVPDDISVIGCDNIPFGTMLTPTLSTVAVDRSRLGRAAVDLLARQLFNGEDIRGLDVPITSQLVVRDSTERPRA